MVDRIAALAQWQGNASNNAGGTVVYHCALCGQAANALTPHVCPSDGQRYNRQGAGMTGSNPIVVCTGQSTEYDTLELAQAAAERLAHQHQADAYILLPKRKVSPKRDVVTTEL